MEGMREQFEAHLIGENGIWKRARLERRLDGLYADPQVEIMWKGFRKGYAAALESAIAKIHDAECLPTCDKVAHDDLCPYVYPVEAIRSLKVGS